MNKEQISAEFDAFFEFPTSDKAQVSSVSCKLFAMSMAEMALSQSEPQVSKPVAVYSFQYGHKLETENEALKLRVTELEAESRTKHEYAMQMLGERDRLQSECDRSNLRVLELETVARDSLNALIYHSGQTRPIERTEATIDAIRKTLWEIK